MSEEKKKKEQNEVLNMVLNNRELRKSVARELAVARFFEDISQHELAERVGTSKSNISRMESGTQNLTLDYIESIAAALGKEACFVMEDARIHYGDDTEYRLKLFDEELLGFRLIRKIDLHCEITYVNEERRHMLPLGLELSEEGIKKWLRRRAIPNNRELVGTILGVLGLDVNNLKGIVDVCMGLSLNDSYWVVQKDFDGTFAEYNLYENEFDTALSLVAYTGHLYKSKNFTTSPELTTGGMLRKAWRRTEDGEVWLYKTGTMGFVNAGNEPYCEFLASQVAETMGLHAVKYQMDTWKHITSSKCKLFTDVNTAYIPIGMIVADGGIEAVIEYYKNLGDSFYQELASMLVFDAIIVNEDRHFGNFGLLRDMKTGEIISPAPIFDNGVSLLCYAMKDDFEDIDRYIMERTNPYGSEHQFIELAKRVMGPVQIEQLKRLKNFHFKENDMFNLPTWRRSALEDMIQDRTAQLIKYK